MQIDPCQGGGSDSLHDNSYRVLTADEQAAYLSELQRKAAHTETEILLRDGDEGEMPSVQGIRTRRNVTESSGDSRSESHGRPNDQASVDAVKDGEKKKNEEPTIALQSNRNVEKKPVETSDRQKSSQDSDKKKQKLCSDKVDEGHQKPNKEPELQRSAADKGKQSREYQLNDGNDVNAKKREAASELKTKESTVGKLECRSESGEKNKRDAIRLCQVGLIGH